MLCQLYRAWVWWRRKTKTFETFISFCQPPLSRLNETYQNSSQSIDLHSYSFISIRSHEPYHARLVAGSCGGHFGPKIGPKIWFFYAKLIHPPFLGIILHIAGVKNPPSPLMGFSNENYIWSPTDATVKTTPLLYIYIKTSKGIIDLLMTNRG